MKHIRSRRKQRFYSALIYVTDTQYHRIICILLHPIAYAYIINIISKIECKCTSIFIATIILQGHSNLIIFVSCSINKTHTVFHDQAQLSFIQHQVDVFQRIPSQSNRSAFRIGNGNLGRIEWRVECRSKWLGLQAPGSRSP